MAHTHYKSTGKVHSFRGVLADDKQEKIRIQGSVGAVAWRIIKLELLPVAPGVNDYESIIKVYREEQGSVTGTIDFTEDELLAAAYLEGNKANNVSDFLNVIFDNALFSRNIYVTHAEVSDDPGVSCNYYIELEEVKVGAAGMAQLAVAAARRTID